MTMTTKPRVVLFDLDHTLLTGDSDVLWCNFLIECGELDRTSFQTRNDVMEAEYKAGTVSVQAFADFYASTLAGKSAAEWAPLRERFLHEVLMPRIPPDAQKVVQAARQRAEHLVLTTASNRFLAEPSASYLGFAHLIACELETTHGKFSGRTTGQLNMREGKVTRLNDWLAEQGLALDQVDSTAYSDSINDLPLLLAVNHAVAVDPDAMLRREAERHGWPVIELYRGLAAHA